MNIQEILSNQKLSSKSRKLVEEGQRQVANLMAIVEACEPDRKGRISQLHKAADKAELAFIESPTLETAEAFHSALARSENATLTFPRINQAVHALLPGATVFAAPAALEIIDAAISQLETEAAKAISQIGAGSAFMSVATVEAELAAAKSQLEGQRAEAKRDPLSWLGQYGHV